MSILELQTSGRSDAVDVMTFANAFDDPSLRGKIERLEGMMKGFDEQVEIKPVHHFAKGLYAREIFIPKGTLLTGKIHKDEHLNIVCKGEISVLTEQGPQRIKAPCTIISKPGTKRVGYAHEDTVWITVHATQETEVEKIDESLVVDTYEQYEALLLSPVVKE
jgi:hypothetical protein